MQNITPSNLKVIMQSKRANIYYLEKCRVMQQGGRIVYLTEAKQERLAWNIPIANTTVILLGTGTSITQAAVRMICSAGVMLGFCGSGGTPLFAGTEIEWMGPQSEYRPTEFVQGWLSFWFDEAKRLGIAKKMQRQRIDYLRKIWENDEELNNQGIYADDREVEQAISSFERGIYAATNTTDLLTAEAVYTKAIYKYAATKTGETDFVRDSEGEDDTNRLLTHGNYLAYGLAACTLWTLGIPHAFAVMHGKTRRGALVFDVADLVKDAVVLPWAFISARQQLSDQAFRQRCLENFTKHKVLDFMFKVIESYSRGGKPS